MSKDFNDPVVRASAQSISMDVGLRSYMISVYNYMAMGLGFTGLIAYLVAGQPTLMQAIFGGPQAYVVMFAPIILVMLVGAKLQKYNFATIQTLFWVFAGLMGLSLSSIFMVYELGSIAKTFFITASMFGTMSIYGYVTQRDLTSMGSFLHMGVIGLIIASIVNMFMQSGAMQYAISIITVLVFTGLTAYDTQTIKSLYHPNVSKDNLGKIAIYGAIQLYIDFINIFLAILQLFGNRR
jgi:FtsH-binding integral membrane protein